MLWYSVAQYKNYIIDLQVQMQYLTLHEFRLKTVPESVFALLTLEYMLEYFS